MTAIEIEWPQRWSEAARAALEPHFGRDSRVVIVLGTDAGEVSLLLEGFVYLEGAAPTVIHDRSGRPDVYPWRLLPGPVLHIYLRRPRRPAVDLYVAPEYAQNLAGSRGSQG